MPELTVEVIRAFEEMALKFTTLENVETVTGFLQHVAAVVTNWLVFLHP